MKNEYCRHCGSRLTDGNYCSSCGKKSGKKWKTHVLYIIGFVCLIVVLGVWALSGSSSSSSSSNYYANSPYTALTWCDFLAHSDYYKELTNQEGGMETKIKNWQTCVEPWGTDCYYQKMMNAYYNYKGKGISPPWYGGGGRK